MSRTRNGRFDSVFQSANTPVYKEEMVSLMDYFYTSGGMEKEKNLILLVCEEANVSTDDFYQLPKQGFIPYCYYKDGLFVGISIIDKQFFDMIQLSKSLKLRKTEIEKATKEAKFGFILDMTETIGQPMVFEHFFSHVPAHQKYKLFMNMYVLQEYGFAFYDQEIVKEALSSQPAEVRETAVNNLMKEVEVGNDSRMTIYRGMGSASTPIDKAMSWTISEKTAYFFANRLGSGGYVVKGEVSLDKVIDFMTSRNEKEVIVLPQDVTILESERVIDTGEEMELLKEAGLVKEFQLMREHFLPDHAFESPNGVHGILHTKRVMLHCISLSNAIDLPENERGILELTALYHDIGRQHDDACTEHGKWSVEKRNELVLPLEYISVNEWGESHFDYLNSVEEEVVDFLMDYHCRSDSEANKAIEQMEDGEQKEMIQRLFPIFKDADALDRVRLGDLDPAYLRTKEARKRVEFARNVFSFLE